MFRPEIQTRVTIAAVVLGLLLAAVALVGLIVFLGNDHAPIGVVLTYAVDESGSPSSGVGSVVPRLNERLRSIGHARALSSQQLEVGIYGNPKRGELESIKRLISGMGYLEFRILADETTRKDQPIIDLAKRGAGQPQSKNVFMNNIKVAEWVTSSPTEFGRRDQGFEGIVQREAVGGPEVLVLMDPADVTGEYLTTARKGVDDQSRPAIHFSLNQQGAARLELLTSQNLPNMGAPNMRRRLGIILDKRLLSAPIIQSTIGKQGMISGGSMSDREVADIVTILNTGSL